MPLFFAKGQDDRCSWAYGEYESLCLTNKEGL